MATTAVTAERDNYLNQEYGIKSWLLTTDHKRIAILYLVSITVFFFIGGFFARSSGWSWSRPRATSWRPTPTTSSSRCTASSWSSSS